MRQPLLIKDATAERLIDAVRVIAARDVLLAPGVARGLIIEFAQRNLARPEPSFALKELTPRETQAYNSSPKAPPARRLRTGWT